VSRRQSNRARLDTKARSGIIRLIVIYTPPGIDAYGIKYYGACPITRTRRSDTTIQGGGLTRRPPWVVAKQAQSGVLGQALCPRDSRNDHTG